MKRIVLTGPESSGKTTLAQSLAAIFDTAWVPEYARTYATLKTTGFTLADLENIAIGQLALVESMEASLNGKACVFLDTWMLELRIWAQYRFGEIPQTILDIQNTYPPDLFLLCTPDLEWEPDPLRQNPHDRDDLFRLYVHAVDTGHVPYVRIAGNGGDRIQAAVKAVEDFLGKQRKEFSVS